MKNAGKTNFNFFFVFVSEQSHYEEKNATLNSDENFVDYDVGVC